MTAPIRIPPEFARAQADASIAFSAYEIDDYYSAMDWLDEGAGLAVFIRLDTDTIDFESLPSPDTWVCKRNDAILLDTIAVVDYVGQGKEKLVGHLHELLEAYFSYL